MYVNALEELIDTLWNVNYPQYTDYTFTDIELIDTLWNVNQSPGKL